MQNSNGPSFTRPRYWCVCESFVLYNSAFQWSPCIRRCHQGISRGKRPAQQLIEVLLKKILSRAWWDIHRIIHYGLLDNNQMLISNCQQLRRLEAILDKKTKKTEREQSFITIIPVFRGKVLNQLCWTRHRLNIA